LKSGGRGAGPAPSQEKEALQKSGLDKIHVKLTLPYLKLNFSNVH